MSLLLTARTTLLLRSTNARLISHRLFVVARRSSSSRRSSSTTASAEGTGGEVAAVRGGGAQVVKGESENGNALIEGCVNHGTLGDIARHGQGDACITLNVGGKEFYTLRSTINANAVLADHVYLAERNLEKMRNGAVFIDRDPERFGFILTYLRNKVEMLQFNEHCFSSQKFVDKFTEQYVALPEDKKVLRELYVEATYYRVPELQHTLTQQGWMVRIMGFFGGSSTNPFDQASKWLTRLRNGLITFTSLGGVGGTIFLTMQQEWDEVLKAIGLRRKDAPVPQAPKGGENGGDGILSALAPSS